MAEKTVAKVDPTSGVQLNVTITESADGGLNVGYAAFLEGTEDRFHPRTTHIVGMLVCAAFFVINQNFDSLRQELGLKTSTEG